MIYGLAGSSRARGGRGSCASSSPSIMDGNKCRSQSRTIPAQRQGELRAVSAPPGENNAPLRWREEKLSFFGGSRGGGVGRGRFSTAEPDTAASRE